MKIELVYSKENKLPTPFIAETNEVALDLMDFIITRDLHRERIHHLLREAKSKTLHDLLQRITFLINQLASQSFKENDEIKIGVHYKDATWENNMKPLIDTLRGLGEWEESSLEQYTKAWRQFYRFLDYRNIGHNMLMPKTIEIEQKSNRNDDFLSHSNQVQSHIVEIETAINSSLKKNIESYENKVISIADFAKIYRELMKIDEVFAAMSYVGVTTLLRVGALCDDFSLFQTKLNTNFKPFKVARRDFKLSGKRYTKQEVKYIAKGGKTKSCLFPAVVHKVINKQYIESTVVNYEQRCDLFRKRYCETKQAKKRRITANMKFTWLNRRGVPVTQQMFRDALKKAGEIIGIHIHPHMLRHTGATQMLYRYLCENGEVDLSSISELRIHDAHQVIKDQLGHENVDTTRLYVKTIERLHSQVKIDYLLNTTILLDVKSYSECSAMSKEVKAGLLGWQKGYKSVLEKVA